MHLYGRIFLKSSVYFKVMNHKMVQADTSGEKTPAFNIVDCASIFWLLSLRKLGKVDPFLIRIFQKRWLDH